MKLHAMSNWGNMTPAQKVEALGNMLTDVAARIPDIGGGEVDTLPVSRSEFEPIREAIDEMVRLHQAIDLKLTDLFDRVATIETRVPSDLLEANAGLRLAKLTDIANITEGIADIDKRIDALNAAWSAKQQSETVEEGSKKK